MTNPDDEYLHDNYGRMWSDLQNGWRLIEFGEAVYLIEFHFSETGPNELEFKSLCEFSHILAHGTESEMRIHFESITGHSRASPITAAQMKELHAHQLNNCLSLTVHCVPAGGRLVLTPENYYHNWHENYLDREPVSKKMHDAGVETVFASRPDLDIGGKFVPHS